MNNQEQRAKLIQERAELYAQIKPLEARIAAINQQVKDIDLWEWAKKREYPVLIEGMLLDSGVIEAHMIRYYEGRMGWDLRGIHNFCNGILTLGGINLWDGRGDDVFNPNVSINSTDGGAVGGFPYRVVVEAYLKTKERSK